MDFGNEMEAIKGAESGSAYIDQPCVALVEITGYKLSETVKEYTGKPYLEITVKTVTEKASDSKSKSIRFYRVNPGDSDSAKEFKLTRMKEFLENAEADFTLKGNAVLDNSIGKRLKCLFRSEEYVGKDKNNFNKPEIKTRISYSFSKKATEKIEGNQSYFHKPLKDVEVNKYKAALEIWERDHAPNGTGPDPAPEQTNADETDDLPF